LVPQPVADTGQSAAAALHEPSAHATRPVGHAALVHSVNLFATQLPPGVHLLGRSHGQPVMSLLHRDEFAAHKPSGHTYGNDDGHCNDKHESAR